MLKTSRSRTISRWFMLVSLLLMAGAASAQSSDDAQGAFFTGEYPNALAEIGIAQADIDARIEATFQQLFYGNDDTQRVYYPVGDDMAYILDVANNDVRSEGMSYGMMIAVQMDKQEEFDRIWKWAKTYMYHADDPYAGYFSWHNETDGRMIDQNPASDGETWFATALLFADARWGSGEGIYDYAAEANAILNAMLHRDPMGVGTPMFDPEAKMIVFVPSPGRDSTFTDPSYHTPHFYEIWARKAAQDNDFWAEAAQVSRDFWQLAAHPETGLMSNYTQFTGEPVARSNYGEYYYADAWRIGMNIALDYVWFRADDWQVGELNRLLTFFYDQGINSYTSRFRIDGTPADPQHRSTGLIATNAVATLAADTAFDGEFVQALWDTPVPVGQYRYYDGLLYLMALLQVSGNFRAYT